MNPAALRVFDLEQPRRHDAPIHPAHVPPGYSYVLHRRHEAGTSGVRTSASGVIVSSDHAGTHIDALCHQAEALKLHGGLEARAAQGPFGFARLGAETIAPIVTRGWLIDLGLREPGGRIGLQEIHAAAAAQGIAPAAGDAVLVRTGNGVNWDDPALYLLGPGMDREVSQWLADLGVRAVGADNMAWDWIGETDPELGMTLPGHVILLVRAGVHILENLYLEELAAAGAHEFTFVCLPLKLVGATGSPVRPVALVGP